MLQIEADELRSLAEVHARQSGVFSSEERQVFRRGEHDSAAFHRTLYFKHTAVLLGGVGLNGAIAPVHRHARTSGVHKEGKFCSDSLTCGHSEFLRFSHRRDSQA